MLPAVTYLYSNQILHSELETSLQAAQDRLSSTANELEKQRDLNEKLENDLLSMNKHGVNGDSIPSESSDVLAGLDLGKKSVGTFLDLHTGGVLI